MDAYEEFVRRFTLMTEKNKEVVANVLSNIFTMRLIGNKTHGDLAEVGIAEFVNQFMYDYDSRHVGKDLFRAKKHEEDIVVVNKMTNETIPISLKAYGDGPLQLSTDKDSKMFALLKSKKSEFINDKLAIREVFESDAFTNAANINVMPLIYREREKQCNILIFNYEKAKEETTTIKYVFEGKGRSHPIFLFENAKGEYICEVRYGGTTANALQRGFWTNTKRASNYFTSATNGWIDYEHNEEIIKLIRLALNATRKGHEKANEILQQNIQGIKRNGTVD